jgi:ketosteroid isomerase-like protein
MGNQGEAVNEHPNAATARRAFEAWNNGQLDVLGETFAQDVIFHFAGNNRMSGTYRGLDEALAALTRAGLGGSTPPRATLEAVLASDDHVMTFFRVTAQEDGKSLDVVLAEAMKMNAEGKLQEVWFLANDQKAYDQFWS